MSNPKDNWRELAEMLGLPTEEPPAQTQAKSEPAKSEPAKTEPAYSHAPSREPVAEEPQPDEMPFPPATSVLPDERFEPEVDEFEASEIDEPFGELIEDAATETPAGEKPGDEEPREEQRGRRRGRRGRRRGRDESPEPTAEGAESDEGRRTPSRRPQPAHAETAVADDEGDDFGKDLWADWNVPSWQDLIDGLHRPDR